MDKGRFEETNIGLVQGGSISPLCSNIMLNELDHELERRGIKFVRYADDMISLQNAREAPKECWIISCRLLRVNCCLK